MLGHFKELMRQIEAGSEDARRLVVEQYGRYMLGAVRRRLRRPLRVKYDSTDFTQAAWASFFAHRSLPARFATPDDLIAFLSALARNKVVGEFRRGQQTQKRDIGRERSLVSPVTQAPTDVRNADPTPSQVAVAHEQWQHILSGLPVRYQQIVQLKLEGYSQLEIAQRVGLSERMVRRVLTRLSRRP